jgi:hypothetical protein
VCSPTRTSYDKKIIIKKCIKQSPGVISKVKHYYHNVLFLITHINISTVELDLNDQQLCQQNVVF